MSTIRQALLNVAIISIVAGITEKATQSGRLKKYTKYAISLVTLLILLSPLTSLSLSQNDLKSELFTNHEEDISEYRSALERSIGEAITADIEGALKLPGNTLKTKVTISNESSPTVESITVNITNADYNRYYERIEYHIKNTYGCCYIINKKSGD